MNISPSPEAAARALNGARIVNAEFLYLMRPARPNARAVFDHALRARLSALTADDGLLLLVNSMETLASVAPLLDEYPAPRRAVLEVNPAPLDRAPDIPRALGWDTPERWQALKTTDRWARLRTAFEVVAAMSGEGWLTLPALDAVYGRPLLDWLIKASHTLGGERPAAVSPVTPFQHYPIPDVRIPPLIVDALNVAFNRDETLPARLADGSAQGVWGKMSLIPRAACFALLSNAETGVWEDDREIDRVLREAGWTTRGLWLRDPALYHQSPPVFNRDDLKTVLLRTLHYSLHIPAAQPAGSSLLLHPARPFSAEDSIWYVDARRLADAVTAECMDEIATRIASRGASWVNWGGCRLVARIGDPAVEVWQQR